MKNNLKKKILICEIEPVQRESLEKMILRRWNVQVLKTENIEEAFSLINVHHPVVSLIGLTQGEVERINNFASKIKKLSNKTRMIFLHAGVLVDDTKIFSRYDCLLKPYDVNKIFEMLKTELGSMEIHTVNTKYDKPIVKIREMIASLKIRNECLVYKYEMEKSLGNSTKGIFPEALDLLRDSSTELMDILKEVEKFTDTSIKPQDQRGKRTIGLTKVRSKAKNKS